MKYSIDLESPFAFSAYWYALGIGLILLALLLRYMFDRLFAVEVNSPFKLDKLHRNSIKHIDGIEKAYRGKDIDSRSLHQQMSLEVRNFIQSVTGLPVETMVYEDMAGLGRSELAELIRTYYEPEFAYSSSEDAMTSLEKGKALVNTVYQRALREKYIERAAQRQGKRNAFYNSLMRRLPAFMQNAVTPRIRHNSLTWMERIELALQAGDLDPYSVNVQMRKAVRSFVYAMSGAKSEEAAYEAMRRANPATGRPGLANYIKEFYDPESTCSSPEQARLLIAKGKELIKRWV